MNIVVLKNNLKEGLNIISGIRRESSHLPILRNFLLETNDGKLTFSSTDLELGIIHQISAKVIEKGSVAVPFQVFSQIIQNLSSERVNLELSESSLLITTDNYRAKISIAPKDDFPIIPSVSDETHTFSCENIVMLDALSSVMPACQISDIRPELSGILFKYADETVKLAATDSFRLAEKTIPQKQITSTASEDESFIIPLKTIQEVVRIFSQEKDDLIISFDKNQVLFKTPTTSLISRLIEGTFPDYTTIIPQESSTRTVVNKNDLTSALKLTSSLSNRLNEVRFVVDQKNKNITIFSATQEFGENEYILPAKTEGEKVEIVFNWRFVLDGIKSITSDDITIGFSGEEKPSIVRSSQDKTFIYIIMPIKSS